MGVFCRETRGIALRGIIAMKKCVFVFLCMYIYPCTMAEHWFGTQKVWHNCYSLLLACYRMADVSNSNGGLLFSIDITTILVYTDLILQTDNFKGCWTPGGLWKLYGMKRGDAYLVACSGCPGMGWKKQRMWKHVFSACLLHQKTQQLSGHDLDKNKLQ